MLRRIPITAPLVVSLALIVLAALAVASQLPALLRAAVAPGPAKTDPAVVVASLLRDHDEDFQRYQDRFNGRSLFYKPQVRRTPRPRPVAPPRPQLPPEPTEPPPPPIPDTYTGPSVLFMLGEEVWFKPLRVNEPPLHLRVGQEQEGVKLLSVSPPWAVRVAYGGGEYDVTVFERGTIPGLVSESDPAPPRSSTTIPGLIDEPRDPVDASEDAEDEGGATTTGPAPEGGGDGAGPEETAEQPSTGAPDPAGDVAEPTEGEAEDADDDGAPAPPAPAGEEKPTEQDDEEGVEESGGDDEDPRAAADRS